MSAPITLLNAALAQAEGELSLAEVNIEEATANLQRWMDQAEKSSKNIADIKAALAKIQ